MENIGIVADSNPFLAQPLVSVLLPVYNGEPYLVEAVNSILSQTYRNLEIIIINDGSTDGSAATIDRFADPRIITLHQANRGLAATLNRAVGIASGTYLARQDADDFSHPARIEKQVRFLHHNPEVGVVGTWSEIWEESNKTGRCHNHPVESKLLAFNTLFDCYFVHSSVMLRKSVFDVVGGYSVEDARQPEDYELWSRVLRNGNFKFANLAEVLVGYREVPHSICRSASTSFLDNIVTLCAENLAWAADVPETDKAVTDTAALIHNVPRRLSPHPDLDAIKVILRKAVLKTGGHGALVDPSLRNELLLRFHTVRNNYYTYRYGYVWGKAFVIQADFISWKTEGEFKKNVAHSGTPRFMRPEGSGGPHGIVAVDGVQNGVVREAEGSASIDVVIPVYNGEKFIRQALDSVVSQTCRPDRIIVVDDGSTDGTGDIVRSFNSEICIDYFRKINGGLSSARNTGLGRSCSDFVAFLDSDDEWYPDKLEEQLKTFRESEIQNLGVVYCEYGIIDDNGNLSDNHYVLRSDPAARGNVFDALLSANIITGSGSGVMVKRKCFDQTGLFDENLGACEDWDMWLRLAEFYGFDFVHRKLVKIRRHRGNLQNDKSHMFLNQLRFYDKWLARLPDNAACIVGWRMFCVTNFVTDFPRLALFRLLAATVSQESRQKLFSVSFGSASLYVICSLPMILMGMIKHALWDGQSSKVKP